MKAVIKELTTEGLLNVLYNNDALTKPSYISREALNNLAQQLLDDYEIDEFDFINELYAE